MRILELVNNLEIGGAERMVIDLSRALAAKGHTLHVACLRNSGPLAECLAESGIEVLELHKRDGFHLHTARALAAYLRNRQVDVVHTHNPLVHHYGTLGARFAGVPVVVNTVHGPANIQKFGKSTLLFELSCLLSNRIVSCCGAVARHVKTSTLVAGRKSVVIRNGIPMDAFLDVPRRKPDGLFVFGAVGRLVPVKDHRTLLQAFALVLRDRPHCRLVILGDGPLRDDLNAYAASLGLSSSVRFAGSSLQVSTFLSTIDTFVLSSLSEGLPLTLLEAMAAGLPIVATSVGAVSEILQAAQCGWISRPSDPHELAGAMKAAVDSSDLPERGAKARTHVQEAYSVAGMASKYETLFSDLLCQ